QSLSLNGTQISISDGNQVDLAPIIPPGGTDDQQLSLNGTTLAIEDGNSVNLASLQDGVNDADSDPTNEFQVLDLNGTQLHISDGNQVDLASIQDGVDDADADPTNEIQTINLTGNTLNLSNGGGNVDLSGIGGSSLWSQNNNEVYYDAGFVGIGTDNPSSILDVGALNDVEVLFRTFSQLGKVGLKIQNNLENNGYVETAYQGIAAPGQFTDGTPIGGTGSLLLGNAAGRLAVGTKGDAPIHLMTGQQTHMYVSNNGKIGIGTTTPSNKLVVRDTEFTKASIETPDAGGNAELALIVDNGDANFDLEIELNGPDYGGNYNDGTPLAGTGSVLSGADASRMVMGAIAGPLHLFSGGNTNMFLNSNGRVGIGTTAPQTEMHLFGEDARFTMQAETEDDLISLDLSTYPDMTGTRDFRLSLYPGSNTFDFEDGTSSADAAVINTGADVSRLALNADNGPVHLMTGGYTRQHITSQGKIGFGIIDPFFDFHFKGPFGGSQMALDADEGSNSRLVLRRDVNPFTGTDKYVELNLIPSNTIGVFTDGTFLGNTALLESGAATDRMAINANAGDMQLMTGGNTRLFVKENGNIGIGTNDPQDELHLDGDLRLDGDTPSIQFHNNTNWSGYMYHDATDLILGNISNNKILLQTNATNTGALDNTGLELNRGDHRLKMGNFGSGNSPMIEATNNGAIDVLGITASGVSISKTGNVTSTPYVLRVVEESTPYGFNIFHSDSENHWELYTSSTGDLRLYGNNSFRGAFDATSGAYTEVSDRRFKTNIRPLASIMNNIMALQPYRYQYKDNNPEQKESLGFVAQEVQQLFPELVQEQKGERENGVLSLNYSGFSVLAIHAIQKQQQTIEQQQSEIEKQAEKIESLEARLERLEALLNK
ncbi:MAG: tail fiber domain-containing protein, partial [Chitinophagales bacterium]|nr:tail fiber domain-containing protein [Chitinophagales bacterium]